MRGGAMKSRGLRNGPLYLSNPSQNLTAMAHLHIDEHDGRHADADREAVRRLEGPEDDVADHVPVRVAGGRAAGRVDEVERVGDPPRVVDRGPAVVDLLEGADDPVTDLDNALHRGFSSLVGKHGGKSTSSPIGKMPSRGAGRATTGGARTAGTAPPRRRAPGSPVRRPRRPSRRPKGSSPSRPVLRPDR